MRRKCYRKAVLGHFGVQNARCKMGLGGGLLRKQGPREDNKKWDQTTPSVKDEQHFFLSSKEKSPDCDVSRGGDGLTTHDEYGDSGKVRGRTRRE